MTDLFTAAQHRTVRTPAGNRLRIWPGGRWLMIDVECDPFDPWPEPAASALATLSELTAQLRAAHTAGGAFYSGFGDGGVVHAPRRVARRMLSVVLGAERGDDAQVRTLLAVLRPLVDGIDRCRSRAARRDAAAAAVVALTRALLDLGRDRPVTGDPLVDAIRAAAARVCDRPPIDRAAAQPWLDAANRGPVPVVWRRFTFDADGTPTGVIVEQIVAQVWTSPELLGLPPEAAA